MGLFPLFFCCKHKHKLVAHGAFALLCAPFATCVVRRLDAAEMGSARLSRLNHRQRRAFHADRTDWHVRAGCAEKACVKYSSGCLL